MNNISNLVKDVSQITGFDFPLDSAGNWLLGHLTKGDFNAILGKWVPAFPAMLNPNMVNNIFSPGFPLLSLVQNLQISASTTLNNLITAVMPKNGNLIHLRSAFLNIVPTNQLINELGHKNGISLDIGLVGFASNPALIAKDIQKIVGKNASTINMVFNTRLNYGYFHIDVTPTESTETRIITTDVATGEQVLNEFAFMNGYR